MPVRSADARWDGPLQGGKGTMRLGNGAWEGPYSFGSRFEEEQGTNPEELIAAAHAGCFSMALSAALGRAGHEPQNVETTAKVHLTKQEAGFRITKIELVTDANVPGISQEEFDTISQDAKANCPVSVALGNVAEIVLRATLVN